MKNLPILTVAFVLLVIGGFQVASAIQKSDPKEDSAEKKGSEPEKLEEVTENDREAVELVQLARNRLFERQSVQAEMAEIVSLGNYTFRTTGSYAAAAGFRYRLEYQVELGQLKGSFLEVCDGQVLHTRRQVSESNASLTAPQTPDVELSRRDIQKIRREAMALKGQLEGKELADALRAAEVGIGGLPAVLASLERSLFFDAVREETVEEREYLVVQGRWRPDRKERLLSGLGQAGNLVSGFMPDLVRIYFAKDSLFPEKFLYLVKSDEQGKSFRPLVTVEFRHIILDQPVPERLFVYVAPPGLEEKDETAEFLTGMRQTAESQEGTAPAKVP